MKKNELVNTKNLKITDHVIFKDNKKLFECKAVIDCTNYKIWAFGSQYYCETVITNLRANNSILKGLY